MCWCGCGVTRMVTMRRLFNPVTGEVAPPRHLPRRTPCRTIPWPRFLRNNTARYLVGGSGLFGAGPVAVGVMSCLCLLMVRGAPMWCAKRLRVAVLMVVGCRGCGCGSWRAGSGCGGGLGRGRPGYGVCLGRVCAGSRPGRRARCELMSRSGV